MNKVDIVEREDLLKFLSLFSDEHRPSLRDSLIIVDSANLIENLSYLDDNQMLVFGYAVYNVLNMPTMMSITKEKLKTLLGLFWKNTFQFDIGAGSDLDWH